MSSGLICLRFRYGCTMLPWIGPGRTMGDFDHEVVEGARLQARQHVHLRAALDLKHAKRLAPAQHVEDFAAVFVFRLDVRELVTPPL